MAFFTHTPKDSAHVKQFTYDDINQNMVVTFQSDRAPRPVTITHQNVPREVFDNWVKFRSAGEFYHRVVKRYPRAMP